MLSDTDATATLAVKDLAAARKFYGDTLGLKAVGPPNDEVIMYKTGNTTINVYRSKYAGTNQATALTWAVENVEDEVRELKARGVRVRALRHAGARAPGRHPRRRRVQDRLVQGPGRKHPQHHQRVTGSRPPGAEPGRTPVPAYWMSSRTTKTRRGSTRKSNPESNGAMMRERWSSRLDAVTPRRRPPARR